MFLPAKSHEQRSLAEDPLQSMRSQRVRHHWEPNTFFFLTLCEKTLSHIPLTSWMLLNCSAGQELFIPFYRWGNWVVSLRSYHWSHRVRTLLSRLPDSPGTVLSPSHAYSPPINQKLRNAATLGQWKNCPVWWDGCLIILRIQSRKGLRNYIYTP